ncbi:MAG: hypothetical protein HKO81_01640 [Flavobacteriaceae bacterium]|nr:hypothetical protein [Bacteroidia bacterium]NNL15326.1 hypothetical protein [Flavobacteriaceae bacterium]
MTTLIIEDKIERTLEYYFQKKKQLKDFINKSNNLTADQIIQCGEEMAELEYKITALQIAKEN